MGRGKKVALGFFGTLVLGIGGMAVAGALLPPDHVASVRATFRAPPAAAYAAITDVDAFPTWRKDLQKVEWIDRTPGKRKWRESGDHGDLTLEEVESVPPARHVGRIADPDAPFGGTWIYEIAPAAKGSTVTITERGTVHNVLFRFMARYLFGYEATLVGYQRSLGGKLGAVGEPEVVSRGY